MSNCASDNLSENVPSPIITGYDPVRDEKRKCSRVVGNYVQRSGDVSWLNGEDDALWMSQHYQALCFFQQRHEQLRIVIGDDALEDGGDALEAHAGVDAGLGERFYDQAFGA